MRFSFFIVSLIVFTQTIPLLPTHIENTLNISLPAPAKNSPARSKYYGTHLVTGGCAHLFSAIYFGTSLLGDPVGRQKYFVQWFNTTFNIQHSELSEKYIRFVISFASLAIIGVWMMYKTPQWTDTYILKKKHKRTSRQNIITFLNRMFIPYPIGIITGEYLNDYYKPLSHDFFSHATPPL